MPLTDDDYDRIEASMTREGFLSPLIEVFKDDLRAEHEQWFAFGERLNRVAVSAWTGHAIEEAGLDPHDPIPIGVRLMARAMNSFSGLFMLANRGLTVEAGTLARSVYESAFWLGWFLKAPENARPAFLMDDLLGQRGRVSSFIKLHPVGTVFRIRGEADLAKIEAQIPKGTRPTSMETVATGAGFPNHYSAYRVLCGHSAHASVTSVDKYLRAYDDQTVGHELSPDREGIPQMLAFGCHALMTATHLFVTLIGDGTNEAELNKLVFEWAGMEDFFFAIVRAADQHG